MPPGSWHTIGHVLLSTSFNTLHSHMSSWCGGSKLTSYARGLGFFFQHEWGDILTFKQSSVNWQLAKVQLARNSYGLGFNLHAHDLRILITKSFITNCSPLLLFPIVHCEKSPNVLCIKYPPRCNNKLLLWDSGRSSTPLVFRSIHRQGEFALCGVTFLFHHAIFK